MMTILKLRHNSVNQIYNSNGFFFFLLTGDNDITILYTYYSHILHHLQAMKMTFYKLDGVGPVDNRPSDKLHQIVQKKI